MSRQRETTIIERAAAHDWPLARIGGKGMCGEADWRRRIHKAPDFILQEAEGTLDELDAFVRDGSVGGLPPERRPVEPDWDASAAAEEHFAERAAREAEWGNALENLFLGKIEALMRTCADVEWQIRQRRRSALGRRSMSRLREATIIVRAGAMSWPPATIGSDKVVGEAEWRSRIHMAPDGILQDAERKLDELDARERNHAADRTLELPPVDLGRQPVEPDWDESGDAAEEHFAERAAREAESRNALEDLFLRKIEALKRACADVEWHIAQRRRSALLWRR